MNKAARNERIKLTATGLNGAAVAARAVGCFAPIVTSITSTASIALTGLNGLVMTWLSLSVGLHLVGRRVLRRIEE
ncbi:amino acid transporter [Methylobacterium sp. E-005]|uniref:amino acid transporter n=1 Tax=Methylobacterium sp. E-005 TaxID=2836549 RepID=UPI001FBA7440|nr:amino acid transporter [Methylobacterium sp. E-005]MCJ2088814.1 amino acid transporter [Methylobacterium sp. E-005]